MRCANPQCNKRQDGELLYAADGVHICPACAELTRNHRMVQLDDFVRIDPLYQKQIGQLRQTIQESAGHWNYLKDQGVQIQRG